MSTSKPQWLPTPPPRRTSWPSTPPPPMSSLAIPHWLPPAWLIDLTAVLEHSEHAPSLGLCWPSSYLDLVPRQPVWPSPKSLLHAPSSEAFWNHSLWNSNLTSLNLTPFISVMPLIIYSTFHLMTSYSFLVCLLPLKCKLHEVGLCYSDTETPVPGGVSGIW